MLRKAVSGIMLTLMLIGMLTLAFNIQPVKSEPTTIIVPDDYPTIQQAINNADEGDTIYVKAGTYYENVAVNKRVSLIGENKSTTIIDGGGTGTVVHVLSSDVSISGFTIRNGLTFPAVKMDESNSSNISNNIVDSSSWGIHLRSSNNNTLTKNEALNNDRGIYIENSCNNIVSENVAIYNKYGIRFIGSSNNNTIEGNVLTDNEEGIHLNSNYNNIIDNNLSNNVIGLSIWAWYNNITGNQLSNNKIRIEDSNYNRIYHNNFYGVVISWHGIVHHDNIWDDGYPSGGNYWSDYKERYPDAKELDDSGIWDIPYVIDENDQDNYPLMKPWTPTPPTPPVLTATVDIHPQALNLRSEGEWITCYVELPESYNVSDINVSTILLNETVPAEMHPIAIGDEDGDGIPDLMVKFDRASVIELFTGKTVPENYVMEVTGTVADIHFKGTDIIRVISPP